MLLHDAALVRGSLFTIPFWSLVVLVMALESVHLTIESLLSPLPGSAWSYLGAPIILVIFALGVAGGIIVALPLLKKSPDDKRTFYLVNAVLAILMVVFFMQFFVGLSVAVYSCDFLQTPNCD